MARRAWRYGLLGVGAVVVLAGGVGAVFVARFDPNSLKPRIEAAVRQATGRDLSLNGPISLKRSLWPTVVLRDVAFANPAGYSRPQMATLDRLELKLAVLPLLRSQFEIARLVLVRPDILLEMDAEGHVNWRVTPEQSIAPSATGAPGAGGTPTATGSAPGGSTAPRSSSASFGGGTSTAISFHDVQIEDGTLAWRDDRKGKTDALALKQLLAKSTAPDAPLTLTVDAAYHGVAFKLGGEVGPLDRLQQPDADTPWPVKLTLAAAGATVAVDGALTHPLQGRGYSLTLDGTIPDLAAIAPLLRNTTLLPLHDVHLAAQISDSGGPVPRVEAAALHLGPADLGAYVSGLRVVSVDIAAPKQDQPMRIHARAILADTPLTLAATVGLPSALVTAHPIAPPQAAEPVPVDVTLQAANASLTVKGTVAHPETLSDADLALDATIPDLSLLSPLAHRMLPAVTQIAFQGRLTDATGGFRRGATLHDVKLTMADGDLSGDIGVDEGPPPAVTGKLHAGRIDVDALLAAAGKPVGSVAAATNRAPPPANGALPPATDAGPSVSANGALPPATNTAPPVSANGALPPASNRAPPASANGARPASASGAQTLATNGALLPSTNGAPPPATNGAAPPTTQGAPAAANNGAPPSASGGASPAAGSGGGAPSIANAPLPATASTTAPPASSSAPRPESGDRLLPDTPIPFGLLRQANADLVLSVDDLKTGGADYRSIDLHVVLQDGRLRLAPLSADLPEGRLDASLDVDATAPAPPVAVRLHAPGLEVAPLLAAAGLPGYASGKLEIYADLRGTGDTPHAIAAGLDGSLGLAMQNGTIDMALLQRLLGPVLQRANLLGLLSHGGSSDLRCFALRADVRQGVAELRALDLNSSALSMDGTGSVNLGEETLAVRLRPQGRLGSTVIVVPVQANGPIRSPAVKVNAIGAAESNMGTVAGAVAGKATPLGLLGGMLGGGKLADAGSADSCAGPLAVARGQPLPQDALPGAQTQPKPSVSGALLHDLFR